MPKTKLPKNRNNNQSSMKFGNHTQISGDLNFAGRDINTNFTMNSIDVAEVKRLFDQLKKDIEANITTSPANKEDLSADVQEIQNSITNVAKKQEPLDEGFLARHFRNIARIAPDILDVVVATLASPALGLGEVARKIAAKAKEEAKS
jgi:uncharacterized protein YqfA (UPF0365 family)